MLSVIYASCHMQALCAECRYNECRYAKCLGTDYGLKINYTSQRIGRTRHQILFGKVFILIQSVIIRNPLIK
jgi:hypothetical protein